MNIKTIIANIDKTKAAKKIVRTATAVSVGKAVQCVVRDHVPTSENPVVNFAVSAAVIVGGSVAASYVLDTLGGYSDQQIDAFLAELKPLFEKDDESEIIEGTTK